MIGEQGWAHTVHLWHQVMGLVGHMHLLEWESVFLKHDGHSARHTEPDPTGAPEPSGAHGFSPNPALGQSEPYALHACLKEPQRGSRDKTFHLTPSRVQMPSCVNLSQCRPCCPGLGCRQAWGWTLHCGAQAQSECPMQGQDALDRSDTTHQNYISGVFLLWT